MKIIKIPIFGSQIPIFGSQIPNPDPQIPIPDPQIPIPDPKSQFRIPKSRSPIPDPDPKSQIPNSQINKLFRFVRSKWDDFRIRFQYVLPPYQRLINSKIGGPTFPFSRHAVIFKAFGGQSHKFGSAKLTIFWHIFDPHFRTFLVISRTLFSIFSENWVLFFCLS